MPSKLDPRTQAVAKEIGKRIQELRKEAKMSQTVLSKRIGMIRTNYVRIERGEVNITIGTLLRIADGLGKNLSFDMISPPKT